MSAETGRAQRKEAAKKYEMSDALVNRIMLCATLIAAASGLVEYVAQIFPVSMVADFASAGFMAVLLLFKARIGTQIKLSLMSLTGLLISLTAIVQKPYAPDGYMVMGGVMAMAFANWPLQRALVIPGLAVTALSMVTVSIELEWVLIEPFMAHTQNSASAWMIVSMCMALLSIAIGGAIHELKSRLMHHIHLLESANERLEVYAFKDESTGIGNERYLEKMIDEDLAEGNPGCLLVISLVGMELYHAIHGHKERDGLLLNVGAALKEGMQAHHLVAKLDGPQFAVWVKNCEDNDRVYQFVQDCVESGIPLMRSGIVSTTAAVQAPEHGQTYRALMKNILVVISMVPNSEFSGCLHFSAEMDLEIQARQALKHRVREALEQDGGFYPVYQAKVDTGSHAISGFEGLARMAGGTMDQVPAPAVFIPVLHEEGLMTEFGMAMLRHIIDDIPAFVQCFGPNIKVAANVSPPLFLSPEFVSNLEQMLQQSAVEPSCLIIEITEEVFTMDIERIRRVCRELQQLGVQISLDDFGSGFSSLSFLRSMNFDEIKIDRGFIKCLEQDRKSFMLLSSICKLGQDLQCRVVVEGVETTAQLLLVEQTQCAQIQGFLFAKPLPIQTILDQKKAVALHS